MSYIWVWHIYMHVDFGLNANVWKLCVRSISTEFDTLPQTLCRLPNFCDLLLTTEEFSSVSWTALPANLCEILLTLIHPALKSISIHGILKFPISITNCPSIRAVTVGCFLPPYDGLVNAIPHTDGHYYPLLPPPSSLENLHINTCVHVEARPRP